MTVRAHRGVLIAGRQRLGVHAVLHLARYIRVAFFAGVLILQRVIAFVLGGKRRVRVAEDVAMAGDAGQVGMHGSIERRLAD